MLVGRQAAYVLPLLWSLKDSLAGKVPQHEAPGHASKLESPAATMRLPAQ